MSRNIRWVFSVVLLYLLFSVLWILLTDRIAFVLEVNYGFTKEIETYKGLLFILVSGTGLFLLLNRELHRREADYREHLQENENLLNQLEVKNEELLEAYDKTIFGWSRVLEMRNREIKNHSKRVTDLSVMLAIYLGLEEPLLTAIRRGALLHDIGKMAIPDDIIMKNSHLDEDERAEMRKHPLFGFEMLSEIEYLRPSMDLILCHHEKWNGQGYPFGLAGEQIPLEARIFAVVDVWDALRSERPYHKPESPAVAMEFLCQGSGEHFDPVVVDAFQRMMKERPELATLQDEVVVPTEISRLIVKENGQDAARAFKRKTMRKETGKVTRL